MFFCVSMVWSIVGPLLMALQERVSVFVVQLPTVSTITTHGFQLLRTSCGLHLGLSFSMLSAWGCLSMGGNQKHTNSFPLGGNVASPQLVLAAGERLKRALAGGLPLQLSKEQQIWGFPSTIVLHTKPRSRGTVQAPVNKVAVCSWAERGAFPRRLRGTADT